jgi:hypothetical protein
MTALRDPFEVTHKKDIKNKLGEVVAQVDYVGWSQSADRLDDVHPEDWSFSVMGIGEDWVHGRLTIGDRHFENIGYAENAEAAWKKEVLKDAVSDAFKRCAALAGVARYLYDKDSPSGTGRAGSPSSPARPAAAPRPTIVADDPYADLPPPWEERPVDPRDGGVCPDHGTPWTLKEAGTNEKTGKSWDAFWKCDGRTDGEFCKKRPSKAWQARHEG